jgi:hypothetical protein
MHAELLVQNQISANPDIKVKTFPRRFQCHQILCMHYIVGHLNTIVFIFFVLSIFPSGLGYAFFFKLLSISYFLPQNLPKRCLFNVPDFCQENFTRLQEELFSVSKTVNLVSFSNLNHLRSVLIIKPLAVAVFDGCLDN